LPPDRMSAQMGLLRMWVGGNLRAVVRQGLDESRRVHFVLDEAASLGQMEALTQAVAVGRGYGVRTQWYWQSWGQVKQSFPNGQDITYMAQTSQVWFGVNDKDSAEHVSARLGDETVIVEGGGTGTGTSGQTSEGCHYSKSYGSSTNRNDTWNQQA